MQICIFESISHWTRRADWQSAKQQTRLSALRFPAADPDWGAEVLRGKVMIMKKENKVTREQMVGLLNEDLAREFQAVIAYVIYSQSLKGPQYTDIARELEAHAGEELAALQIAKQIDYFNGTPTNKAKEVKLSDKAEDMLRFDLENEKETILNYRERIRQAEAMGEFALSEVLRRIIAQEQEHLTDLADALGIDNPVIEG